MDPNRLIGWLVTVLIVLIIAFVALRVAGAL